MLSAVSYFGLRNYLWLTGGGWFDGRGYSMELIYCGSDEGRSPGEQEEKRRVAKEHFHILL